MTDRQNRRVTKLVVKWSRIMGLDRWRGEITFLDQDRADTKDATFVACMDTEVSWPYRQYRTNVYPVIADMTDDEVEGLVVHELTHVLLAPMRNDEQARSTVERVTTDIEMALLSARDAK